MRWIVGIAVLLLLAAAGFAIYVRMAGDDPARWHVDPLAGPFSDKPNQYLASPEPVPGIEPAWQMRVPVFAATPAALAAAVDAAALAEPGTVRLAGSVDEGWMTYVQRSALLRFPDYISVRVIPAEGGATLAILSRSRFGYSDMGVNKARVRRWLAAVAEATGE